MYKYMYAPNMFASMRKVSIITTIDTQSSMTLNIILYYDYRAALI